MPRRSGSGKPPSISPWCSSSGGNVTGTVSTTDLIPSAEAVFQNEVPPRIDVIFGAFVGMSPHRNSGGSFLIMLKSGK